MAKIKAPRWWTYQDSECNYRRHPSFGSDEYGRRTLVGYVPFWKRHVVYAFWTCYCANCGKAREDTAWVAMANALGFDDPYSKEAWDFLEEQENAYRPTSVKPTSVPAKRRLARGWSIGYVEKGVSLWRALRHYSPDADYEVLSTYEPVVYPNLVSSLSPDGKTHAPIIDVDFRHTYVPSTTPGHGHLYLDVPISRWRWVVLMLGLRTGKVIEQGNFWWSLRRGQNFARIDSMLSHLAKETQMTINGIDVTHITLEGHEDYFGVVMPKDITYTWTIYQQSINSPGQADSIFDGVALTEEAAIASLKTKLYAVANS